MKRILSMMLCLAMLMSGACFAEAVGPQTASVVISDMALTLDGAQYPINPEIAAGVLTEGDSTLLDFAVLSEGEALLPVQVKLDETGVALNMGASRTAYVLPMELLNYELGLDEIADLGVGEWLESYTNLLSMSTSLQSTAPRMTMADADALYAQVGVEIASEDVTAVINGVEQPAMHRTYTFSHDQLFALIDLTMAEIYPEYMEAYLDYMNATFAMAGEETAMDSFSYAEMMAEIPVEMVMAVDETVNADYAGSGTISFTITLHDEFAEDAEPIVVQLPMEYTAEDADTMTFACQTALEVEGTEMDMIVTIAMDGKSYTEVIGVTVDDMVHVGFSIDNQAAEDGSSAMNFALNFEVAGEMNFVCGADVNKTADGASSFDFGMHSMDGLYGFSCHGQTGAYAVEDRISAAEPVAFSSLDEDDPAFMGLAFAAMGLAGDLEILMNEESVAPLAAMVVEMINAYSYDVYGDDYYVADDYEYDYDDYEYELDDFEAPVPNAPERETPKSIRSL